MSFVTPMSPFVFSWIVQSAVVSSVLLSVGYLVAAAFRQPVERLRILQWTLTVTFMSLVVTAFPHSWKLVIPVATVAESEVAAPSPPLLSTADDTVVPEHQRVDSSVVAANHAENAGTGASRSPQKDALLLAALLPGLTFPVTILYLAGAILCLFRWGVARTRLYEVYRNSCAAAPEIQNQLSRLSNGATNHVDIRLSSHVTTPMTWGVWSPVIMLPQSVVANGEISTLRYYLAHEWSHIQRRDFWTWQLAVFLQIFLYYNPLYWVVRRSLLVSMDRLADTETARHGETPLDYAEFLVELARCRHFHSHFLTLGISDKHSQLRQRVEFLLNSERTIRTSCSQQTNIAIAALAIFIGLGSSVIRFEARAASDDKSVSEEQDVGGEQPDSAAQNAAQLEAPEDLLTQFADVAKPTIAELLKACSREHEDGSITYHGFVTDASTAGPIAGATVKVHHKLSRDPTTGGWTTLDVTEHKSNAIGLYSFTLPPEQTSESSLYIEVEAHHPNYASKSRSGYSHAMIRKNLKLGELPFYTQIKLWPGKAIEGKIVSPEGQPLANVKISMYAASDEATGFPAGSFSRTTTDPQGRFRIVPPTPGDGVLWIKPSEYSPQAHRIADRRGDWGEIRMTEGATITGQVLDVNGDPVPNVQIEARRRGDGEDVDEFLNSSAVANQIGSQALSDDEGAFQLRSLPDGDYHLEIEPNAREGDYDPPPLKDVFLRQTQRVVDKQPQQITIRAVPHVLLRGTFLDSKDQPRSGHEVFVFGRIGDLRYFARSSSPGNDGKFELKIPHGLRDCRLDLSTNEHSSLKWRMSRDEPLQRGRNVSLGTVEDDIYGFEVVRYTAPILLVRAVDQEGNIVSDVTPIVTYARDENETEQLTMYTTGSHVSFESQGDGRHRSSQLLPDEPILVTVKKDGYEVTTQELILREGEEKELEFLIKPDSDSPSPAASNGGRVTFTPT